jgi:predicted permease
LGVAVGVTALAIAMAALAIPALRLPRPTFAACFQCSFRFNTYVILAVAARLPDHDAVALASVLLGVLVPLVNIAAVLALAEGGPTHMARQLAGNPLIIATVAGILTHLAGVPLPALVDHVLALLAGAALPLGLLAVGAALRIESGALPLPALVWFHTIKLALLPAMAWVAARAAHLSALEMQVVVLVAAVPTATSAYILAVQMRGDGPAAAWLITSGTLLAAFTLPLWLTLVAAG